MFPDHGTRSLPRGESIAPNRGCPRQDDNIIPKLRGKVYGVSTQVLHAGM